MNSGPPRLRIDNVINMRMGTDADDDEDFRKRVANRQAALDAQQQPAGPAQTKSAPELPIPADPEQGDEVAREDKAVLRNRASKEDDVTT